MDFPVIRFPFLKGSHTQSEAEGHFLSFNPGLSDKNLDTASPGHWYHPAMPFSPEESDVILKDIKARLVEQSSDLLHGLNPPGLAADMRLQAEMSALKNFIAAIGESVDDTPNINILKHAQMVLLWRWAHEELFQEIAELEKKLNRQEAELQSILTPEMENPVISSASSPLAGSWSPIILSAAYFLPNNAVIYIEGNMAADLKPRLRFRHAERSDNGPFLSTLPANMLYAFASINEACEIETLQPDISQESDLQNNFTVKRYWITRNDD